MILLAMSIEVNFNKSYNICLYYKLTTNPFLEAQLLSNYRVSLKDSQTYSLTSSVTDTITFSCFGHISVVVNLCNFNVSFPAYIALFRAKRDFLCP